MTIFLDDLDRRTFVYLFGDVVEDFNITCWNFCLMGNHYHATFNPTQPNLSRAIQRLNGRYASWWNDRHAHVGHVFQGRFKDQIVQREGYLTTLCRYVVMNPVRAKIVKSPEDWPWSSYRATIGLSPCPSFLSPRSTLNLFGDVDVAIQRERFANYVIGSCPEEDTIIDRFRSKEVIVGDKPFKDAVRAEAGLINGAPPGQLATDLSGVAPTQPTSTGGPVSSLV